jgi:hypothetical protein
MCDDTGLFQHAVYGIPDRHHGYCIDDNARALLLCCRMEAQDKTCFIKAMLPRFAAFIQHGWNPDTNRFRNFMSYARQWLEPVGSEDSHGRTLWALGRCAAIDNEQALSEWAAPLFAKAMLPVFTFTSPRAWAFTLLGLDAYCPAYPADLSAESLRNSLAERLLNRLLACQSEDWRWFEDRLTYDNARLCEALILSGKACRQPEMVSAGLRALDWLLQKQTAPEGHFRPVGSHGFLHLSRKAPAHFDQQPVEACATIAACLAAALADSDSHWQSAATQAFSWYSGANDLGVALVDFTTGSCRDGLHPDRANDNRGAESLLSYLLAQIDMGKLAKTQATGAMAMLSPNSTLQPPQGG